MKKFLLVVTLCALLGSFAMSQSQNHATGGDQSAAVMKEFTRTTKADGLVLNFALLNNKTVDFLFQGTSKSAVLAKTDAATVFYIWGISEKDTTLDTQFEVIQDGKSYPGEAVNMKNLQAGPLAKGTRISGLIRLSQKINVAQPFTIKGGKHYSAEFKLSQDAIKLLEN